MSSPRCSELSRASGEPLGATATNARHWLLVEVPGGWSREVTASDALPEGARAAVAAWLERTPSSRLLFVRRPGRVSERLLAFVVDASEEAPAVRRLELPSLGELRELDLGRAGVLSESALVLVCGHGSRDQCCALRGTAVFGALASSLGEEELWISSHHGGHRFAANVLVLPAGLHFGRVDPVESVSLVGHALVGSIALERYRGRVCLEPPVQAAEIALRRALGLGAIDELRFTTRDGDVVRFRDLDGREHAVSVREERGPVVPASCGSAPEPQTTFSARVVSGPTRAARTRSP